MKNRYRPDKLLLASVLFLLISLSTPLWAEEESVRLTADKLIYDQDKKVITLIGNVRFLFKKTILSGEKATFNTSTQIGKLEGNVRIYQPGTTIVADRMTVYYEKKVSVLSGRVKIVTIKDINASPGAKKEMLPSGLTTLTCDKMSYNWLTREGKATGGVEVEQKERRAYADRAHYSGISDLITLEGKVRFEQGSNNWVTSEKAYIDLKKETFMAVGGVTGNFLIKEQDKNIKDKKKKSPARHPDKIVIPELPYKEKKLPE